MLRLKEWLKTPLGIAITTAFIGPAITIVYDIVKNKPVFSTIVFALKWLYTFILSILNFNLKVWWVILGILGCIFILYIISKLQEMKEDNQPEFLKYKKIQFKVGNGNGIGLIIFMGNMKLKMCILFVMLVILR